MQKLPDAHRRRGARAARARMVRDRRPVQRRALGGVARGSAADVDAAVTAAHTAFTSGPWPELTATQRGALLRKLGDPIAEHAAELAEIEVRDNGKLLAGDARPAELPAAVVPLLRRPRRQDRGRGHSVRQEGLFNYTRKEPLGVVAIITPWNSPLLLLAWKLAPGAGRRLHGGHQAVGVHLGPHARIRQAVRGGRVSARRGQRRHRLRRRGGQRRSSSTRWSARSPSPAPTPPAAGSTSTRHRPQARQPGAGRQIAQHRLRRRRPGRRRQRRRLRDLRRHRPDLHRRLAAAGAGLRARRGRRRVVALARHRADGRPARGDHPGRPDHHPAADAKVLDYIDIAQHGGRHARPGRRPGRRGRSAATAGSSSRRSSPASTTACGSRRRRSSARCWPSSRSTTRTRPSRIANDVRFGLGAGVWTSDIGRAFRMSERIQSGTVWVNTYRAVSYMAPFGGFKDSGLGRENG